MKASLDTNVMIHLYRAGRQQILFDFFEEGVFIYEQIRSVESQSVLKMFQNNVDENRLLYGTGDLGEVYAISLAQTIGAYSLVTDDIKPGGPYMSLLQLEYEVMPFTFAELLILRYLLGEADELQTVDDFNAVNLASDLNWSLKSQVIKFIKRFWKEPYKEEDRQRMQKLSADHNIKAKSRFASLRRWR